MEWSEQVIDIREQFPLLPLDKTLYIAQKLGIKHPTDPKNKLPIIMTTDMLLTVILEESIKFIAHSIKPSNKLTKRVVEKLQIEKESFKDQKIEWALITERQINYNLVRNVEWLHNAKNNDKLLNHHINSLEDNLYCAIQQSEKPLAKVTREQDELFGLPSG
ncbi:TnsA endonuclease N-terminal domain-containing protein [Paenibacillus sp. BT-177]|uniref:TnsA endonuclease N-terminal domain-containing protein n=1 Tax=Paenibacillus sp. BT-177 TaxID=2986930 RepID=UPI0021F6B830|nr:TnsA endonuclease N-terminal domain-containing protein [Paenibacillus sp. BT-177]